LRALHVDHGIHADSPRWEAHCRSAAAALGVAYECMRVEVPRASGLGLEAAAREARYAALGARLEAGELLVTAHHADDQLETLFLRMLRGTGVRGLRGILELAPCGRGFLGRPLLRFTRAELTAVAESWGLTRLEDPANADPRHDRSFLRAAVLPAITRRWPSAAHAAQGLAERMRDAEEILDAVAAADLAAAGAARRIPRAALEPLSAARRRNLLRLALRELALPMPSAERLEDMLAAVLTARADARTQLRWPGGEARVYRQHLYLFAPLAAASAPRASAQLTVDGRWLGPEGELTFRAATDGAGLPAEWLAAGLTLRFRAGGERFRPLGRAHHAPLKHWFQEAGVVPWLRDRIPLLYRNAELVAVGDLWLAASTADVPAARRYAVVWAGHPPLF
jgi:tRNA(Ile)-lysidine synthase